MQQTTRDKILTIQREVSNFVLQDYNKLLSQELNALPVRRKTKTNTQYRAKILSDYRTVIRRVQRSELSHLREKLLSKFSVIMKSESNASNLLNSKDRFGYTFNYSIQRANTRLISQIARIYRNNTHRNNLDKKKFSEDVARALDSNYFLKSVIEYHTARAINSDLFDTIKATKAEKVKVNLSASHRQHCICNDLAKTYLIDEVILPPFHLHCRCYVTFTDERTRNL